MKTIERIFKHLNEEKVELKAERIELSVANDIKNGIKAGNSHLKKLASAENFLKKAQNTFEDALDKTRSSQVVGIFTRRKQAEQRTSLTRV